MAKLQLNITDVGLIELGDETNSPLRLNKRLSDISLLTKRSDVYSYTFKVPDTKVNKDTLQYYYHSRYNNWVKIDEEKECDILIDGVLFLKGKAQIKSSTITDGIRTFTVVYKGGNIDWWAKLKDYTLADLDWSGIASFTMDKASIVSTWTNTYVDGYAMSLIDRGKQGTVIGEVGSFDFRPDIFVAYIFQLIELKLGITFTGSFVTNAGIRKLVLPYFTNSHYGLRDDVLELNHAITNNTVNNPINTTPASDGQNLAITFHKVTGVGTWVDVLDTNSIVNTTGQLDPILDGIFYKTKCNIDFTITNPQQKLITVSFYIFNLTDGVIETDNSLTTGLHTFETQFNTYNYNFYLELSFPARLGKTYEVQYVMYEQNFQYDSNGQLFNTNVWYGISGVINSGTRIDFLPDPNQPIESLANGVVLNIGDVVDNKTSIFDIFNDLVRIFNLYAETDLVSNDIELATRDVFYEDITTAEEYSDRIDLAKPITVSFNSEKYKRYLDFKYVVDSNDGNIQEINKNSEYNVMSHSHDYGTAFNDGRVSIDLSVLTSSLVSIYWGANTTQIDPNLPPITAMYWKENGIAHPPFQELKAPKILNYVYGVQVAPNGSNRVLTFEGTNYTNIPACLVSNIEGLTVPIDLSFDGANGLVNTYYWNLIGLIETGKSKTSYCYWDVEKYKNSKFRKIKHFNSPEWIKGYWILEAIEGFDPLKSGIYKTKFLQVVPDYGVGFIENTVPLPPDLVFNNNGTNGVIGTNSFVKNAIVQGSLGVGMGLKSSLAGQTVTGQFNEDAPGALEVVGNGSVNKPKNLYLVTADGKKIDNPERMTSASGDVYYEEINGIKKYLY